MADDIVELCTKNESLKSVKGSYDGKLLQESQTKLLKQNKDEKRAIIIMFRMER